MCGAISMDDVESILSMCKSLDETCQSLNKSIITLNTFVATSEVKEKYDEEFKVSVNEKLSNILTEINKIDLLEAEDKVMKKDILALQNDMTVILNDEKDKVKVWKRNTFAFGMLIFSAVVSLIFKGAPK